MRPKGTKKDGIKYLSESELAAFMKATRKNKRDSFLFSLMLFVGARVSEICQLKLTCFLLSPVNEYFRSHFVYNYEKRRITEGRVREAISLNKKDVQFDETPR